MPCRSGCFARGPWQARLTSPGSAARVALPRRFTPGHPGCGTRGQAKAGLRDCDRPTGSSGCALVAWSRWKSRQRFVEVDCVVVCFASVLTGTCGDPWIGRKVDRDKENVGPDFRAEARSRAGPAKEVWGFSDIRFSFRKEYGGIRDAGRKDARCADSFAREVLWADSPVTDRRRLGSGRQTTFADSGDAG